MEIGKWSFRNCRQLSSLHFPSSLRKVGEGAFYACKIVSDAFPDNLEEIGGYAFYGCKITEVRLGDGCKLGGEYIFALNSALENVELPEDLTILPKGTFESCGVLKDVKWPESLEVIESDCFFDCTELTIAAWPRQLKRIGSFAFFNCGGIKEVVLGPGCEFLGVGALANLSNLQAIYCMAATPPECDFNDMLNGADEHMMTSFGSMSDSPVNWQNIPVYVPSGTREVYETTAYWNMFNTIVETEDFPGFVSVSKVENEPEADELIHDLYGCRISDPIPGEIYIRAGKKFIMR